MGDCKCFKEHIISYVEDGSIAYELGIKRGDTLVALNGKRIQDFIDYSYFEAESHLDVLIKDANGELIEHSFDKDEEEPLGIGFENDFMDKQKACKNKCVFCFIDQMPKKLRKTLYFKDDDWRLSLMMGNYVTLTNVDEVELDRIIKRRVSPLYISVHTTDPDIRAKMLGRGNCDILPSLKRLADAGIVFHCQIVMCPTLNDGEILKSTLTDLYALGERCASVAIVPVGVTKFRDGLYPLIKVGSKVANMTIDIIDEFRTKALRERGSRFVFASDEIYITAKRQIPSFKEYEDFDQIEDGIGMYAMFAHEFLDGKKDLTDNKTDVGVVCGELIYPLMQELLDKLPRGGVKAVPVENRFFGNNITVTGLITGSDIIAHVKEKGAPKVLIIPEDCLKHGENVFLDDVTLENVKSELACHEIIVGSGGYDLIEKLRKN